MNEQLLTERNDKGRAIRVLVGQDDNQDYRVNVPLRIKTIEDALAWLRPSEVPANTPRQGEFFFVKSQPEAEVSGYVSNYSTRHVSWQWANSIDMRGRHHGCDIIVVHRSGSTAFIGRKHVKTHDWTALPLVYARGTISHPEHGDLDLGNDWCKVIPNKAHGPFRANHMGND